jgi:3alpha(or 20beta)-hydroxysteroid dehydrogenase
MADGALSGKVALITGAARGQGRAEVERFRAEGAQVVAGDVTDHKGIYLDVTKSESWDAALEMISRDFGRLDVLVNNAGIYRVSPLDEMTEEDFRRVLDVNLLGPFLGIKAVASLMPAGGSIINVASLNGLSAHPGTTAYTASKFGLRGLTKAASLELAPRGIRVNAILPGVIETPMIAAALADHGAQLTGAIPLGRIGQPRDIASAAVFLASDEASWITGTDLIVDGGQSSQTPGAGSRQRS